MSAIKSPFEAHPPSARRLLLTALAALMLAAVILLTIVLPAEYSIDPTGIGGVLGLKKTTAAEQKIELLDTLGGNEKIDTNSAAGGAGSSQPIPLPNPAVHQSQASAAQAETFTITLPPFAQTEIKAVLKTSKVLMYAWKIDRGQIYVDFHGHSPDWTNKEAFVRYEENKASAGANGSLVAAFPGEHGWYWLNGNAFPVVITLTVQGYYDKIIDYGVSK